MEWHQAWSEVISAFWRPPLLKNKLLGSIGQCLSLLNAKGRMHMLHVTHRLFRFIDKI